MFAIRILLSAFVAVLLSFNSALAQSPSSSKIKWTSTQAVELRSNTTNALISEIFTSSSEVSMKVGTSTKRFRVVSVSGSWTEISSDGSLVFSLDYGGKSGRGVLARKEGNFSFELDFSAHKDGLHQKFLLSEFQLNP